jgi:hypothetical protein
VSDGRLITTTGIKNGQALSVTGGAKLEVPTNGGSSGVTSVGTVTITGANSLINLHDNDLISNYGAGPTNYTTLANAIKTGMTALGGAGTTGITANTATGTMLGIVDDGALPVADRITLLSGMTVPNPATSVLVKYTWFGDANLDGKVNSSDYILIDSGFTSGGTKTGWLFGDFNYSGSINSSDYILIDTGFTNQNNVVLPEPTTLGLLGLGAMGMLRRRRRV